MARIAAVTKSGRTLSAGKLLERDITHQVRDYLQHRGWRAIRMQRTVLPGSFQSGEPGQPDYLFLRYMQGKPGAALAMWIEFKTPTGRVSDVQRQWHRNEQLRGAMVAVVDDFQWFAEEYERVFAWLHSGEQARGQLEMFMEVR